MQYTRSIGGDGNMTNTRHDNAVRSLIRGLKRQGFRNIKASIPGYDTPEPIGKDGRIPDIVATKRGIRKIIEVEPKGQVEKHKEQHSVFRKHAAQKKRTIFEIKEF